MKTADGVEITVGDLVYVHKPIVREAEYCTWVGNMDPLDGKQGRVVRIIPNESKARVVVEWQEWSYDRSWLTWESNPDDRVSKNIDKMRDALNDRESMIRKLKDEGSELRGRIVLLIETVRKFEKENAAVRAELKEMTRKAEVLEVRCVSQGQELDRLYEERERMRQHAINVLQTVKL